MKNEREKEAEKFAERQCIDWVHNNLLELAGEDFTEEEIRSKLDAYLKENNKNVLELNRTDWENIYSDVLLEYLEESED